MTRTRLLRVNQGRGFGIVRPLDQGDSILVHFTALAERPAEGWPIDKVPPGALLDVEYEYGRDGRPRAVYAQMVEHDEPTVPGPTGFPCDDPAGRCDDPNSVLRE